MTLNADMDPAANSSDDDSTAKFDRDELVRGWREYESRQPRAVPLLKYAAKTDMGQVRENNEDKFDWYEPEDPALLAARGCLFLVGDGIGGAQAGQIASEMTAKLVISGYYNDGAEEVQLALYNAITSANDRVYHLAQMIPERNGMGTTLTAVVFQEERAIIAQVGDSRAYLIRQGAIQQITHDHSWVEENVRAGLMTREDAETSPFRNVITRSVGAASEVYPEFFEAHLIPGDTWVLCSDGLTGYVKDDELLQIAGASAPSEAVRQFIELANSRGGRDNITVFIIRIDDILRPVASEAPGQLDSTPDSTSARPASGLRRLFGRAG